MSLFFAAVFLVDVFLVAGAAVVLVTRPDFVLPRTLGTSTTAGAWETRQSHCRASTTATRLTAAGVEDDALRLVEVLAFGLAAFSFFAAGAFLVVLVLALVAVAVAFFGAVADFSFFGLVSALFCLLLANELC